MSMALNKWQLLVIVLVLLSLLVTTFLIMHGVIPGLWHQVPKIKLDVVPHYG